MEIAALKAKIKARENQPGFAQNVMKLKERLLAAEEGLQFRDIESGQFVSDEYAYANPDSTVPVEAENGD